MVLAKLTRRLHPISRINFLPRVAGSLGCTLCAGAIVGNSITTWPLSLLFVFFLLWPLTALSIAHIRGTRSDELLLMHGDCILASLCAVVAPDPYFIFAHLLFLAANGLFTGSYRLLVSLVTAYTICLVLLLFIFQISVLPNTPEARLAVYSFLLAYFSLFSILGYSLIREFFNLNIKVERLSNTDSLTGCFNRTYLDKQLPLAVEKCVNSDQDFAITFTDIDYFKSINDNHGHPAGDQVLINFVQSLQNALPPNHWLARFGGEEFVIVMENTHLEAAEQAAENYRAIIEKTVWVVENEKIAVTSSFGVSGTSPKRHSPDAQGNQSGEVKTQPENSLSERIPELTKDLLMKADRALYLAKDRGRNRVEVIT